LTHLKDISDIPISLSSRYSLLILDLKLLNPTNIEYFKKVREQNLFLPIIATGPNDISDAINSFTLGINLYHSKPICCELLKAQIGQLTSFFSRKVIFEIGDIMIDLASKSFFVKNKKIPLTYQEFHLLALLMRARGHIVSRDCISKYFAGKHEEISYAAVDTLVSRIRSKLKSHLKEPLIQTVHKVGYRINTIYFKDLHIEKS
jgi:two-component system OmpR family response regulator